MSAATPIMTLLTGEDLLNLPEEDAYRFERIEGVVRRMPGAGAHRSAIKVRCGRFDGTFVDGNDLGTVTGADEGFSIQRDPGPILIPDVAFTRRDRLRHDVIPTRYLPVPPDLLVQAVSPSNRPRQVADEVSRYHRASVPLVWVSYPDTRSAVVHPLGQPPSELGPDEVLNGGEVLPGFHLPLVDLYRGF